MSNPSSDLKLSYGIHFSDLYSTEGVVALDGKFLSELQNWNPDLHAQLLAARQAPDALVRKAAPELVIATAPSSRTSSRSYSESKRKLHCSVVTTTNSPRSTL
jgi:hypothetical protein